MHNQKERREKKQLSITKYYADSTLTGQNKSPKILSQDSPCPRRDSNRSSPEYESGEITACVIVFVRTKVTKEEE
jgi:hypothetical protein